MNDKLKERFEELTDKYSHYIGDSLSDFEMVSGRSVILPNDILPMLEAAYNMSNADRWVRVEDRLPESNSRVLAFESEDGELFSILDSTYKGMNIFMSDGKCLDFVTHWMPLPAIPTPPIKSDKD